MPKRSLYARCGRRAAPLAALAATLVAGPSGAAAGQQAPPPPCSACIVLTTTPGQSLIVGPPLDDVEVLIDTGLPAGPASDAERGVAAAIAAVRQAGGRPGVLLQGPDAPLSVEPAAGLHRVVIDVSAAAAAPPELAFRLKTRLTELRGALGSALLGISGPAALVAALLEQDLAPYLDFVGRAGAAAPAFPSSLAAARTRAAIYSIQEVRVPTAQPEAWIVELPKDAVLAQQLLTDVARTARLLKPGLIPGGAVTIGCGELAGASYLDPGSLDTIAVAAGCGSRPLRLTPEAPAAERVKTSAGDVVIRVPSSEGRFAEGVQVVGAKALSVREVIARHQAAAARQRRFVRRLISTGRMTLTFDAPGFSAPMAITSEARIYTAPDRVEIEQRDVRVNGIAFQGGRVPRLPLLEPERVASPPLAIALTDVYRYELAGQEDVGGVRCYVVRFEPVDRRRPLFAGRAWIAMDGFAMVKAAAVQTGLRGPIVTSEQTDEFRRETPDVWLLARSDVRQVYEGAGYRTPIHRVLEVDRHEVNPPGFEARLQTAYASPSIMLRDTPEGFRYLRRERGASADAPVAAQPSVSGAAERVRTIAVGAIFDPNISRPLPFAGLSYVDFNLFGTGAQLNGFFGGTYGQVAVAAPSLGGTRWQLGARAFGIASSYNDRAFTNGREIYAANIAQRPAHASMWLLRPLTPRLTARVGYDFDYTHYRRGDSTADTFVVPASQQAHGLRLGLDAQWAGWSASGWWAGVRRAGWRSWGEPASARATGSEDGFEAAHGEFQRVGAVVTRSIVVSPRLVGRVEAAWMTGRDLDRFSRYAFGSFDNRLRGYPAALIRYDRGAVVRGSAAWAAGRLLRLDGFLDAARVRDPGFGRSPKPYVGVGAAAEVPAPFGTLVAVEWGYGFQGIDANGGRGTQVVRVSGYKMF